MGKSYKSAYAAAYAAAYLSTALPWAAVAGGPALDLNFLDATVTPAGSVSAATASSVNDPTFTYTGASHKRQWNSEGVLEYAPHNLISYSSDIDSWSKNIVSVATGQDDPDGGTSAFRVTASISGPNGGVVAPSTPNLVAGDDGRIKLKAKYVSGNGWIVFFVGNDNAVWFDVQNGTVGTEQTYVTSSSITSLGDGWYECEILFEDTIVSSNNFTIFLAGSDNSINCTSGDSVDLYHPQYNKTPSPDTYIATTGSAVYAPRVGTNNRKPVTNLLVYPGNLDNTDAWSTVRASVSGGQTDPFGGTDAWKLIENTDGSSHGIRQTFNFVNGKTYTYSTFVAPDERGWVQLVFPAAAFPSTPSAYFNVTDGLVGTTAGIDGYGIAAVEGTNYFRVWATAIADANATSSFSTYIANADNGVSYTGDGSSGLYIYMPLLNEGGIEDCVGAKNLLDDVQDFSAWTASNATVTTNSTTAPDGSTTADTLGDNSAGGTGSVHIRKTPATLETNTTYKFTAIAKQKQLSDILLYYTGFAGVQNDGVFFSLTDGAATSFLTNNTGESVYIGNGFWQLSIEFTTANDGSGQMRLYVADGTSETVDRDGTSDIYLAAVWLTKGDTVYPAPCYPQTGFVKAGYTAEASATNLHTDSEDFSAASWTINNTDSLTVTTNQSAAPDDTTTMDRIEVTDTTAETKRISDALTITANTDYVDAYFVRADEQQYVGINLYASSENFATTVFDLYAGTVVATDTGTTSGTVTDNGVISCGNGIYLIWAAHQVNATSVSSGLAFYASASPTFDASGLENYAGTAGDGLFAWGADFKSGTYPSSYIKTSGSTATRVADSLSTTDMSWYNESEGTVVTKGSKANFDVANERFFNLTGTSSSTRVLDTYHNGSQFAVYNGTGQDLFGDVSNTFILSTAYKTLDYGYSKNGNTAVAVADATVNTATRLHIGQYLAGTDQINGHIKSLTYYNTRKTDAELETFSTNTDPGTRLLVEQAA